MSQTMHNGRQKCEYRPYYIENIHLLFVLFSKPREIRVYNELTKFLKRKKCQTEKSGWGTST